MRTQVVIIGAGPAGLLLAQLLHLRGIDSVVLETKSRHYIEHRVRAGVLEHQSVDILKNAGVGERLLREGLLHQGVELRFSGQRHRIDFGALTGRSVTIYGQQEVVKDLVAARVATGRPLHFEVDEVSVHRCRFRCAGSALSVARRRNCRSMRIHCGLRSIVGASSRSSTTCALRRPRR